MNKTEIFANNKPDVHIWGYKHIIFISVLPFVAIFFVLFLVLIKNDWNISRNNYWQIQVDWFTNINQSLSGVPSLWLNLTNLGDAFILLPVLSVIILLRPQAWAAMFGAIPLATLLSNGGKKIAAIPRPAAVLDHDTFSIVGSTLTAHTSLPSGHSTTYFTAVTAVIGVFLIQSKSPSLNYFWILLGFLLASTLAISRIAVGAHWPLDIIVGASCGYFAGISGVILTQRYKIWWQWLEDKNHQSYMAIFVLLLSIAALNRALSASESYQGFHIYYIAAFFGAIISIYIIFRKLVSQLP